LNMTMDPRDRKYWKPEIETMPRDALTALQNRLLREQIAYVYEQSPFYRRKFDAEGITPADIQTADDLQHVPFTTKEEYEEEQRRHPPYGGMLCVPQDQLTRYWTTSGTTGRPRVFGTTTDDYLDYLESAARVLWAGGVRPGWKVMVPFAHGHWIGLWGVFDATWYKVGAQIVPVGGYDTKGRILKMAEIGIDAFCGTPTYAAYLSEVAREMGIDVKAIGVKSILMAGEPAADATRRFIEDTWGARTVDFYGNTENLSYHGVDCETQTGFHFWEDRVVAEVIDPVTGKRVEDGAEGELVCTNLTAKSMPAIRFRTHDLTRLTKEPCACGRTHNRIQYILGRRENVVKIRDINIYPRVIEDLVRSTEGLGSEFRIIFERDRGLDYLKLQIEPLEGLNDSVRKKYEEQIQLKVKTAIGITPRIEVLPHGTLEVSQQKANRVIDKRLAKES
jgi:phenylacetate-CoA ligase